MVTSLTPTSQNNNEPIQFAQPLLRCSEKGVKIYKVRDEQRSTNSVVYIFKKN